MDVAMLPIWNLWRVSINDSVNSILMAKRSVSPALDAFVGEADRESGDGVFEVMGFACADDGSGDGGL